MRFQISRDALLRPVQQVLGVVEKRQTLPVLANLLLDLEEGRLSIVGSDLEVEMMASMSAIDGESGVTTVPSKKLADICRSLPDDSVLDIHLDGDRLVVKSGRSRFTLSTLPADDFPVAEVVEDGELLELPQSVLRRLIDSTHFCMAHQDVRFFLNGLLLEVGDRVLRAVATDGHRMALSEEKIDFSSDELRQVIVPRKGVIELMRLLEHTDEKIAVRLGSKQIQIELPGYRFTSKLIDGRFPNYERVLPVVGEHSVVADRVQLRGALNRASILSNEKYRGVRVELTENWLGLTAHNPEQEIAEEELEVEYVGDPLQIGFNVSYLQDALNSGNTEKCVLWMKDSDSSCLIVDEEEDRVSKYVIMPMRL
ncbi:MAG: DNA polymerase III subunit beta [Chromatiales bacterium]|nr:DNA polymerase III subunit beta [Chromatiales bacterium]